MLNGSMPSDGVVSSVIDLLKYKVNGTAVAAVVSLLCLLVPSDSIPTWDDHDRSGRFTCRDFRAKLSDVTTGQETTLSSSQMAITTHSSLVQSGC